MAKEQRKKKSKSFSFISKSRNLLGQRARKLIMVKLYQLRERKLTMEDDKSILGRNHGKRKKQIKEVQQEEGRKGGEVGYELDEIVKRKEKNKNKKIA